MKDKSLFKSLLSYAGWYTFASVGSIGRFQGIPVIMNLFFGVVANAASIILIILFIYFLNHYIILPMQRMYKGLSDYRRYGKSYRVDFDYGGDQIQAMNEEIKEIVDENRTIKKRGS